MTVSEIKTALVEACLNGDPKLFISCLKYNLVVTNMPNKLRFYSFFKYMVETSQQNLIGGLTLQIENADWKKNKGFQEYNFYDQMHKYARLSLLIKERDSGIYIEILPF